MRLGRTPDHPVVVRCAGLHPVVHYRLSDLLPYLGREKVWVECESGNTPFLLNLSAPSFTELYQPGGVTLLVDFSLRVFGTPVFSIPVPPEYKINITSHPWKAYYYLRQCLWPHSHLRDCACPPWKDYTPPLAAEICGWVDRVGL